jgi:GTP-binding protein HflX
MAELIEIKDEIEKVILIGVNTEKTDEIEASLEELEELVRTAGAVSVGQMVQNRERVHPGTYLGKGKIEELKELIWELSATGIVCDDELTPAQFNNLRDALDTKVMDRTLVILDIFAKRASTNEGKIQVELAQLKYRLGRLTGLGISMSRLGAGIGTKGPGEKKLEMDRRLIKERISQLGRELSEMKRHREVTRSKRVREQTPVIAIVGYTNAGKSTLLNTLTDAGVLEEDKLFATLDPTTKMLELPAGQQVLVTDTVGFIKKLPHHLIQAFRSTLEEAKYADIILHVVDSSNPQKIQHMETVYETLADLDVKDKTIITLFNKVDKVLEVEVLHDEKAEKILRISAKTGLGLETIKTELESILREDKILIERIYPYDKANLISYIRKYGELLEEEYQEDGIFIKAFVPMEIYSKVSF